MDEQHNARVSEKGARGTTTSAVLQSNASTVAISRGSGEYPATPPFSPSEYYAEYPRHWPRAETAANHSYARVREALHLLSLDSQRFGTPYWNPLSQFVRPGDTVVIKPNLVRNFRESSPDHADCLITHGSVIRAIVDYSFLALSGRGRIVIADAPQNDGEFDAIRHISALDAIRQFYQRTADFTVEIYDLRPEACRKVDGVIVDHQALPGDPAGYIKTNLGVDSMFEEIGELCGRLYGAEYDRRELVSHHTAGRHEYLISRTVLTADCVISVPKLKTHKKTGLTANLKNLVGINGNKNWLPHHREGTPSEGGDQFRDDDALRRTERRVVELFKRGFPLLGPLRRPLAGPIKMAGKRIFGDTNSDTVRSGNWYGNDTTWRMVLDLNRILMYVDSEGQLHDYPVRRFLSIVDGFVAGEGNGPLDPTPKAAGVILAGTNPVAVDLACAGLMGFDYSRIPMIYRAFSRHRLPLVAFEANEVTATSNDPIFSGLAVAFAPPALNFEPHFGWKGHIEKSERHLEAGSLA